MPIVPSRMIHEEICLYLSNNDFLIEQHDSETWRKTMSPHWQDLSNGQTVNTTKILGMSLGPKVDKWTFWGASLKANSWISNSETFTGLGSKYPAAMQTQFRILCLLLSVGSCYPKNKIRKVKRRFPIGLLLSITQELVPWRRVDLFLPSLRKPSERILGLKGPI